MRGLFSFLASRRRRDSVDVESDLPKIVPTVIQEVPATSKLDISFQEVQHYQQTEEDIAFERLLRQCCKGGTEKLFYTKVVGVTFPNGDGSKRLPIISKCVSGEPMQLKHHTEIAGHPDAVGVHREGGEQLGYLDSRLAGEILRDDGGKMWLAVFRRKLHHPETRRLVGAVLCMVRLASEPSKQ